MWFLVVFAPLVYGVGLLLIVWLGARYTALTLDELPGIIVAYTLLYLIWAVAYQLPALRRGVYKRVREFHTTKRTGISSDSNNAASVDSRPSDAVRRVRGGRRRLLTRKGKNLDA